MNTKTSLLVALLGTAAISLHAQTSVPTPLSVAPDYNPPVTQAPASSPHGGYTYQAPHANTWDFYLTTGAWLFDNSTMNASHVRIARDDYVDGKIKMNLDDSWYFGFGVGYNITEQLSAHVQFAYTNPDYDAVFRAADGRVFNAWGSADISTGDLAIRYDLLKGKFRPFVQASIGFMYIDTGIPNGPNYYWANYYWNDYYSDTPTVDHTYFTLGATAGVNYYFTTHFFGQLSYTGNWANTPHNWMFNQRIGLSLGWNY